MSGTIFSVVEAMRPMPPRKMNAAMMASTKPITGAGMPKAESKAEAIELACTMLPMKPRAAMMASAKNTARGLQRRPLVM